jgi:hypothetical protein
MMIQQEAGESRSCGDKYELCVVVAATSVLERGTQKVSSRVPVLNCHLRSVHIVTMMKEGTFNFIIVNEAMNQAHEGSIACPLLFNLCIVNSFTFAATIFLRNSTSAISVVIGLSSSH